MEKAKKKPADISQADWDSVDVPEATDEEWARATPFKEVFPKQYAEYVKAGHKITVQPVGRPRIPQPKAHISFRLAADIVDGIKASGRGYNAKVEKVLREALAKGKF